VLLSLLIKAKTLAMLQRDCRWLEVMQQVLAGQASAQQSPER